ncbi:MAG: VOC family protein [Planctomycetota bacterium]|jgi:catechol 2,3-dioxygenase-like lactoylglutathione lyase family enzyme
MTAVKSIGGVSLYTTRPRSLAEWYSEHLGLDAQEDESNGTYYCDLYLEDAEDSGLPRRTVLTLLEADGRKSQTSGFTLSYVVENLRKTIDHLSEAGVEIEDVKEHAYGRSAWIRDPEGRLIELWED